MTVPVFLKAALALVLCMDPGASRASAPDLRALVDETIIALKEKHAIPGLSVGLTIDGKAHLFHYGVASLAIAANPFGTPSAQSSARHCFPVLGLRSTFVRIPPTRRADYAKGYAHDFFPDRPHQSVLSDEAYGVTSSAPDLLRFVQIHLGEHPLPHAMRRAVERTQAGVFSAGPMVQSMIWERHALPATLAALSQSSTNGMSRQPFPVTPLAAPDSQPALLHKTGSTNGFGAYAAFAPGRRMGIVILANHPYPHGERIRAAHEILTKAGL